MITKLLEVLKGKKTYTIAALMVVYGLLGIYLKTMTPDQAMQFVLNGLGLSALRAGVNKV